MKQKVLTEWSGSQLIYVEPTQVVKSFGYALVKPRTQDGDQYLRNAADRASEADGEVNSDTSEFPSAAAATDRIKEIALRLGADLVGITHVDQAHVYKGEDVPHQFAVVIAVAMDYDAIKESPSAVSNEEVLHIYDVTGAITTELAKQIRELGYPARAHTLRFEQLNMLPHAYAAGLGELGKHGSLINRDLGSSFRVSVVTTDLPMNVDEPRIEGIDDSCINCKLCVDLCPGDAITHDKQEVRGTNKWVVDTEACAPYFGSYHACGICLQVCPWNARGFEGKFKKTFIETIKGLDRAKWREELQAGVQEPWSYVERPTEFPEDWRMQVTGKGPGSKIFYEKPTD